VQLDATFNLSLTAINISDTQQITLNQTAIVSSIQFSKLSAILQGCFAASNPNIPVSGVSNAGKVSFFQNFVETNFVFGDANTTLLGEYIWLSEDGLPGQGQ